MPTTLKLDHRKSITYESALKKDANIISQAAYFKAATELYQSLWDQRQTIQALVKHHLRLSNRDTCIINTKDQWIRGSFNICIPIEVQSTRFQKKFIFRCPMPHKLAEARYPGTVDEKLSSEVGTYAWMQHHCPDIRIPHLYGFGFSDHRHVSYHTYCLIAPVLTMLLVYSLSMSNKNLSTPAFGVCSNAISAIFFDAIPSRPMPPTQRVNDFLLHI
jgi:hypothetical protein